MNSQAVLYYFAAVTLLAVHCVAEEEGKTARYKLESDADNADVKAYLKAMGYGEDVQQRLTKTRNFIMEFQALNKTHLRIKRILENKTCELIFEPGKEFESELFDGRKVKNIITVDNKAKSTHRVIKMDGFEATHDAVFSDNGVDLTVKAKGAAATLHFSKEKGDTGGSLTGRDWGDMLGSWG